MLFDLLATIGMRFGLAFEDLVSEWPDLLGSEPKPIEPDLKAKETASSLPDSDTFLLEDLSCNN